MSSEAPAPTPKIKFKPKRKNPNQLQRAPSATPSVGSTTNVTPLYSTSALPDVGHGATDGSQRSPQSPNNNNNAQEGDTDTPAPQRPAHTSLEGSMKPPPVPRPSQTQRKAQPFKPGQSFGLSDPSLRSSSQTTQSQTQSSALGLSIFSRDLPDTQATNMTSQTSSAPPPAQATAASPSSSPRTKKTTTRSSAVAGQAFTVGSAPPQASPTRSSTTTQQQLAPSPARAATRIDIPDNAVAGPGPNTQTTTVSAARSGAAASVSETSNTKTRDGAAAKKGKRKASVLQNDDGDGEGTEDRVATSAAAPNVTTTKKSRLDKGKGKAVEPVAAATGETDEPEDGQSTKKKRAPRGQGVKNKKQSQPEQQQQQQQNDLMSLAIATQVVEGEIDREEAEKRQEELNRQRQGPKKKRGRPPKKQGNGTEQKGSQTTVVPKKRGRPRKVVTAVDDDIVGDANEDGQTAVNTRTRKAKNKARQSLAATAGIGGEDEVEGGRNDPDAQVASSDEDDEDDEVVDIRRGGARAQDEEGDEDLRAIRVRRRKVKRRGNAKQGKMSAVIVEDEAEAEQDGLQGAQGGDNGGDGNQSGSEGGEGSEGDVDGSNQNGKKKERTYTVKMVTVDPTVTTLQDLAHARDDIVGRMGEKTEKMIELQKQMFKDKKMKRAQRNLMMRKKQARRARGQPSDQETDAGEDEQVDTTGRDTSAAPSERRTRIEVVEGRVGAATDGTVPAAAAAAAAASDNEDDSDPEYNSDDDQVKRSEKRQRQLERVAELHRPFRDGEDGDEHGGEDAQANENEGEQAEGGDDGSDNEVFEEGEAPQLVLVDGKLVVDQSTLTVNRTQADFAPEDRVVVEEDNRHRFVNYSTHSRHSRPNKWTAEETELFYEGVRQFGTDFEMIAGLFPDRNRAQIKKKWTKEDKLFPQKITAAFNGKKAINLDEYSKRTGYELSGPVPEDPMDEINARRAAEEAGRPAADAALGGNERSVSVKVKKREMTAPSGLGAAAEAGQDEDNDDDNDDDEEEEEETELERLEREEAREREIQAEIEAAEGGGEGRRKKKRKN
ncbi:hypothetical protein ACM66B_000066 [Microbotryomycetes sp. NB124-2]